MLSHAATWGRASSSRNLRVVSERHKEDLGSNVVVCKHRNYLRSPTKGKFLRKPEAFQDCKSLIWPFVLRSSHMNVSIIDMA